MDGKNCNSSGRNSSKNGKIKSIQAMNVYSNNLGICLATEFIEEKQMKFLLDLNCYLY